MKKIAVSQRVMITPGGERRDAIDQRWMTLLEKLGILPILLPNQWHDIRGYCKKFEIEGLLLTGGNDLAFLNVPEGAPERDRAETTALEFCLAQELPVLGVCRGAQLLVHFFGGKLNRVSEHAGTSHLLSGLKSFPFPQQVSSYHHWGIQKQDMPQELEILSCAPDGVVEAFRHFRHPITGVQWHPERETEGADLTSRLFNMVFSIR